MSGELKDILKLNTDTVVVKKYEVYDLNRSTTFSLSSGGTWSLRRRADETVALNGSMTQNNSDTDRAGNTIKTVSFAMNLVNTDILVGLYYLLLEFSLTSTQTEVFRVPVEIVDWKTKGVA